MSQTTHTIDPNFKQGGTVGPIEQLNLTTSNPQTVAIVDGAGSQITSFGGGTQYADGDATATPTGTVSMGTDGSNVFALHTDTSGDLQIDVLSMPTTTVTGTVAVTNAGLTELAAAINASSQMDVNIAANGIGLATSAKQDTLLTELQLKADLTETQPVSLATVPSHAVTNAGTFAVQVDGAALTSLQLIDDTVATLGTTTYTEAATKGLTIGAVRRDADTTLVDTTNEIGPLQMNAAGQLKTEVFSGETLPVSFTGSTDVATQTTLAAINTKLASGTVIGDVNLGATDNAVLDSIAAATVDLQDSTKLNVTNRANRVTGDLAHDAADEGDPVKIGGYAKATAPTAVSGDADRVNAWFLLNGAQATVLTAAGALIGGDAANGLDVDVTRSALPSGASTLTEQQTQTTALQLIDDTVYVDDADWTADTSKHVLSGAVTQVATTANTDGDTTPLTTNAFRELRTAIPESDLATATTAHVKKYYTNAGAVTDGIIWSPAAGKRWYVTDLIINTSAAATITLEDDKAGGDEAVMKFELAANSGISHTFTTPWYSGEDAADLIVTTSAGNIYITVVGYEI